MLSSENLDALFSAVVHLRSGVLVLAAESSQAAHDSWDPDAAPVSFDRDSALISVQPSVDGPVRVDVVDAVEDAAATRGLTRVLEATFECEPDELTLSDPDGDLFVRIHSESEAAVVQIFCDDPRSATHVVVRLGAADA